MKISRAWEFDTKQWITILNKKYDVHEAIRLAKDLEVVELPIDQMNICYISPCQNTLRSFVEHMKSTLDCDLDHPILLNEDGEIIDGRHRLCKALLHNEKTIKARRFKEDPADCFEWV